MQHPAKEEAEWFKGRAVVEPFYWNLANDRRLISLLTPTLGENVVVWGASNVVRVPGQVHHWHSDIESSRAEGGFVSIWLGVHNSHAGTCLKFVTGSHRFGMPMQKALHDRGLKRENLSDEDVLRIAREFDSSTRVVELRPQDGEAVVFDGRIWHGSENKSAEVTRHALLLQYARADVPVKRPNFEKLTWPVEIFDEPRPQVIAVAGNADSEVNRIAQPPMPKNVLSRSVFHLPLFTDEPGWQMKNGFLGQAGRLSKFNNHSSQLLGPQPPHPPEGHFEEELMIIISGQARIESSEPGKNGATKSVVLGPGDFWYFPAFQDHTLHNIGEAPLRYTMFKWAGQLAGNKVSAKSQCFRLPSRIEVPPHAFRRTVVFNEATSYLRNLHAHYTDIAPEAGYDRHSDPYHVAIVVLEGEVICDGETQFPGSVVFYHSGKSHDLRTTTGKPARYLVFEFHEADATADAAHVTEARTPEPGPLIIYAMPGLGSNALRFADELAEDAAADGFKVTRVQPGWGDKANAASGLRLLPQGGMKQALALIAKDPNARCVIAAAHARDVPDIPEALRHKIAVARTPEPASSDKLRATAADRPLPLIVIPERSEQIHGQMRDRLLVVTKTEAEATVLQTLCPDIPLLAHWDDVGALAHDKNTLACARAVVVSAPLALPPALLARLDGLGVAVLAQEPKLDRPTDDPIKVNSIVDAKVMAQVLRALWFNDKAISSLRTQGLERARTRLADARKAAAKDLRGLLDGSLAETSRILQARIVSLCIPLISSRKTGKWDAVLRCLQDALNSILNQSDPNFRVLIGANDFLPEQFTADPRVEVIQIDNIADDGMSSRKFQISDASYKRGILRREAKKRGAKFQMEVDADDLLHRDVVKIIRDADHPHATIFRCGYVMDMPSRNTVECPGPLLQVESFDSFCGTCYALTFSNPAFSGGLDDNVLWQATAFGHHKVRERMQAMGLSTFDVAEPRICYMLNTGNNLSIVAASDDGNKSWIRRVIGVIQDQGTMIDADMRRLYGLETADSSV